MSFLLYLYFSLQNISTFIGFMTFFATIGLIIFSGFIFGECNELIPILKRVTKYYFGLLVFSIFLSSIPDIKQISMIFGIPAAIELSKNPDVQKIPQNILNVINKELEEKVKKTSKKEEE